MKPSTMRGRLLASTLFASAAALGLTATVLTPGVAAAQDYTSGNLNGRVLDDSGNPVAGATVTTRSGQGVTRAVTTGADGTFRVTALPAGAYSVDVSADGFAPLAGQTVGVAPGGSSVTFTLSSGTVSEVVVTGTTRATPDFNRTDTGLTIDVQQLQERVPVSRSISAVALLTPGASMPDPSIVTNGVRRNQSTVVLSGTSAAETVYYINGLNVTDQRNFLGYSDLPFDAIQTIDVKTGGYQAEFGRATGGVVNIVTRSGSNEFHGGISLFYSPDSLRSKSPNTFQPGNSAIDGVRAYNDRTYAESYDATVYASGPIWKDHLFFFGLVNPREQKQRLAATSNSSTDPNGTQVFTKTDSPRWLTKLDFNLTDKQRLEATVFSDRQKNDYSIYTYQRQGNALTASPGYTEKAGGLNQIYKYTGVFTDWFTLSALYGKVESQQPDQGELIGVPRVRDLTGVSSPLNPTGSTYYFTAARASGTQTLAGEDIRKTYRVDADFYVSLVGDHHFRVGYDKEDLLSTNLSGFNGGYRLDISRGVVPGTTLPAQDYGLLYIFGGAGAFRAEQSAYYLQDSWDLTPDLTLQLGVRNDLYDYKNREGESYLKTSKQWAPRLGFSWDPRGAGEDKVYGSFGRYYLPIATNTSIRAVSGEAYRIEYHAVTRDAAGNIVVGSDGIPTLGAKLREDNILSNGISPDPRFVASQSIKPMYEEEFIVGYQHNFREGFLTGMLGDWSAGVRFIRRDLKSTIEDTDVGTNGAIGRYCARTNDAACVGGAAVTNNKFAGAYVLFNPGSSATFFADLAGGPAGTNGKYITLSAEDMNLPKAKRHYQALEFTFDRPWDGKWSLQGSYTLGESKGNYEGAVKSDIGQVDTSITQDFDTYWREIDAYGYLPNHHRHTFKLFGAYELMDDLTLGGNLFVQSGRKYGCLGYGAIDPDPGATPAAWSCPDGEGGYVSTPRGSQGTTGWMKQLDLNLTYNVERDGFGTIQFRVDVFNVLNEKAVLRVVEQGEVQDEPGEVAPFYGLPRSYQSPRSVRFGVRYQF